MQILCNSSHMTLLTAAASPVRTREMTQIPRTVWECRKQTDPAQYTWAWPTNLWCVYIWATGRTQTRWYSHLSWIFTGALPLVFGARVMLGAGVEGRGGGDSEALFGGSPLDGETPFWSCLASYSKVRLGLGKGFTGVPTEVCWPGGSGLSDLAELTLNLCLSLESLSGTKAESGSVATEQMLLRLLVHVLSKSSPITKDFCLVLSGA